MASQYKEKAAESGVCIAKRLVVHIFVNKMKEIRKGARPDYFTSFA